MKFRHILLGVVVFSVASVYFKGPMTPEQQAAKNKKDVEQKKGSEHITANDKKCRLCL